MPLTNTACKNAKPEAKPRRISDGGGLYLEIYPNGSKYWRWKYRFNGKENRLAFGVYPEVSLQEAREKHRQARKLLAEGKDPSSVKKQEKLISQIAYENTFENIAREWHETKRNAWSAIHHENMLKRMENDLFPKVGARPIKEVTAPELLATIRQIEARGAIDVARRVLQISGQVFRFAIVTGRADRDPSGDLKGALKTVKSKNHAFLREDELPEYLAKLEAYDGHHLTKLAMRFLLLTFVRSVELRGALWEEIDFDKKEWRIPAERMKMKTLHIVPLAKQAIALLREIQAHSGNREHVFPNQHHPRSIMSENTLLLLPPEPYFPDHKYEYLYHNYLRRQIL
jgi:hypothetical protein